MTILPWRMPINHNHHPGQLMMNTGSPLFGRPSMESWINYGLRSESQNLPGFAKVTGRDHHPFAFTVWATGGGINGGTIYGKTVDLGWGIAEDPVHINDLHATILHLFGLDHTRLTYRFQGRDFRLTDVGGRSG